MNTKKLSLLILGIFAIFLMVNEVSAVTIFSDGFETDLSKWILSPDYNGNNWNISNIDPYQGNAHAQFNPSSNNKSNVPASMTAFVSTVGYKNISFSYQRKLIGLDVSLKDLFKSSYSVDNGLTWIDLEILDNSTDENNYTSFTQELPDSTDNNSNFLIRFQCNLDRTDEFCRLDNILIEGIKINQTTQENHPSEIQSCSDIGNPGELEIRKIRFNNNGMNSGLKLFGDRNSWFPFEEVEVEVEIKNKGNYDINDIEFSWGLWDTDTKQWVIDFNEEDKFKLRDDDEENFVLTFKIDDDMDVDLRDLTDGDHYRFYASALGVIDDSNSPNDGEETCDFDFKDSEIVIERDFVILDNIEIPETVQCGENVNVIADVWNIGDRDQNDVSVRVVGGKSSLNFNETTFDIGDIDSFDNQKLSFSFTVPKGLDEGFYSLKFEVRDEDRDIFKTDFDDDLSEFVVPFQVKGNCEKTPSVLVSAELESEAKAGNEMVVKVTLTNTGNTAKSFVIDASGFEEWAEISELPETLLIDAGNSSQTTIKFNVNKDASGEKKFNINVYSGTALVATQPVSVSIKPKSIFPFTGAFLGEGSAYLFGLGLLNIILVIIIIIVAVRIARKK